MSVSLVKSLGVKGCAVWKLDENGATGQNPNVDNVSIQLPAIELETTSINLMGTLDVPDISRVGNLQLSVTVPLDVPEAMELLDLGKSVRWLITWASMEYNSVTGETTPKAFTVEATGFVSAIPNAEVNAGAENTGEITMNLVSYKKTNTTDKIVQFEIDRGKGIFKLNGKDLISGVSSLY